MRVSAPGWQFIGPMALHLFASSAPEVQTRWRKLIAPLYACSVAFVLATWFTPWVIRGAVQTSWGWGYTVGPLYPAIYAVTMVCVAGTIAITIAMFRGISSPGERRHRPWIALSVGLPMAVASVTDALLPMLEIQVPRFGTTSFAMLGLLAVWNIAHFGYSFLTPGSFATEILATLPDGVALLHLNRRVRFANDGLARLSGRTRDQLEGMAIDQLLTHRLAGEPLEVRDTDCLLKRGSGEAIPVSLASSVLHDRQGFAIGLVVVVRDAREVQSLRNRLVTSGRLAAVGELAAGIAHEINNPIAFTRANLSQLHAHWKTVGEEIARPDLRSVIDEGTELIEESLEGIDRAAEIVRSVKGFSHAGTGAREPVDLNELLDDVLHVASTELRERAVVERDYGELPLVPGARQELKQVFLNLVVNASQAIEIGGAIRLATRVLDDSVSVQVEDDGCGIPASVIGRIFDPFFTTKPVGEGTGIGLGIAYQIVSSHDGEITVESKPGTGTCFRVTLPR